MFRKSKLDKLYERATNEIENREYVKAQNTYLECFAINPNDIGVINNLAQLSRLLGEEDKSRGYNELLLKECNRQLENGKTEHLLISKSNALVSLGRNDEAMEVVDELLELSPDNTIGLFHKAQYLELKKEYEKSLHCINEILKQDSTNVAALLSKGRVLCEMNEFKRAKNCYDFVLKIDTKNKAAVNLKSELIKKESGDDSTTAHDLMLDALESWDLENFESAENQFKEALEKNPSHDEIWFAQGELFIRMGKITSAISSFEKAFKLNPNSGGISEKKSFFKMLKRMEKINRIFKKS